jgi:hypothetical protein
MYTALDVLQVLDLMVEKKGPDYVYPREAVGGCMYRWTKDQVDRAADMGLQGLVVGQPACLVGAVLAELNLLDRLIPASEYGEEGLDYYENNSGVQELDADDLISPRAITVLEAAQTIQDTGQTWGTAASIAHQKYEEVQRLNGDEK